MRESYTGGLNSFIVNPNLKAETGLLSELGVLFKNDIAMFKLSGFYTGYVNMITRIRLSKEVDSLRRRMRINLTEAYVYGTVLDFGIYPAKGLKISGNLTYMISKGKEVEIEKDWLDNRPAISGGLFVNYALMSGFYVTLEADIIADNYEADPNNSIQKIKLPSENFYNFKLSYNNSDLFNIYSEFYIRINNILDSYRELQNGLYDSGRTIYLGYKLSV